MLEGSRSALPHLPLYSGVQGGYCSSDHETLGMVALGCCITWIATIKAYNCWNRRSIQSSPTSIGGGGIVVLTSYIRGAWMLIEGAVVRDTMLECQEDVPFLGAMLKLLDASSRIWASRFLIEAKNA